MNKLFNATMVSKIALILSCLALVDRKSSDALLLGNLIGCNSFGCRLAALESDVSMLKQQVARLGGDQQMMNNNGYNNFRPNMNQNPYNQILPSQLNQNPLNQNGLQIPNQDMTSNNNNNNSNNNSNPRVNYANYLSDYPVNQQQLRRNNNNVNNNNGFQNGLNSQFFNN